MKQQKQHNRVVFGTIILIFGVLSLIDNLNIFNTRVILDFWPTVFILIGALKMSRSNTASGQLVGGGFIAIGTLMTLQHLGIVYFSSRQWWPIIMIFGGLSIIFKDRIKSEITPDNTFTSDGQDLHTVCNLSAVMSASKVQNASIEGSATINVFAVWGGIELKIPTDWQVVSQGIPILGGFEDRTIPPIQRAKILYIQGYAIMGSVEIKN